MKKAILSSLFVVLLCIQHSFASEDCKGTGSKKLNDISDILSIATPGAAIVSSLLLEKPVQTGAYILELSAQELFVEGAKEVFLDSSLGERPCDEDEDESDGFISSHVSATTSGAIKLWELYPENYWIKSLSVASVAVVGYQRIESDSHTPFQVGLGVGTAFLFDYLGRKVTDYFNKDEVAGISASLFKKKSTSLRSRFALPEKGDGLITMLSLNF